MSAPIVVGVDGSASAAARAVVRAVGGPGR
ncbi:hypothetical protein J2S66_000802 [Saccharothrix longispora]|uniref:Universal stress protein family protein n=1 Tax=Saccharothrix longispora TaxID=33920 RepID=A0ABU1PP21_9PSEU|nr:hypothetical protein [Saccharothrix longispora]